MAGVDNSPGTKLYEIQADTTWEEAMAEVGSATHVRIDINSASTTATGLINYIVASAQPIVGALGHTISGALVPATTSNAPTWAEVVIPKGMALWVRQPAAAPTTTVAMNPTAA